MSLVLKQVDRSMLPIYKLLVAVVEFGATGVMFFKASLILWFVGPPTYPNPSVAHYCPCPMSGS